MEINLITEAIPKLNPYDLGWLIVFGSSLQVTQNQSS